MADKAKHYEQAKAGHKKFQRHEMIDRAKTIDKNDERTLEVIFSSDDEVDMWYGSEVLEHGDGNVDLSYMNAKKAPLLIDHRAWNSDNQIGVIESARIDGHKGYAKLRFGKGVRASEYYEDVVGGIRSCISVGYEVNEWRIEEVDSKEPKYIATKWTPREVSLVTFPADDSAEVLRGERTDFMFELQSDKEEEAMLVRSKRREA